jgi:hypothetical protein
MTVLQLPARPPNLFAESAECRLYVCTVIPTQRHMCTHVNALFDSTWRLGAAAAAAFEATTGHLVFNESWQALTYMSQAQPTAPQRRFPETISGSTSNSPTGVRIIKHRDQQSRPAKKACQLQTGIGAL